MRNLIQELLELTPETYEKMVINYYHQWCILQSHNANDCQRLLANAALFNWWYSQYSELELKFYKKAIDFYGKATVQVMRDYHKEYMANLNYFYSRPLLKSARNQQPLTPQHN